VLYCHQNGVARRDPKVGFHFIHANNVESKFEAKKSKSVHCVFIICV
jgi:hypothetical protein